MQAGTPLLNMPSENYLCPRGTVVNGLPKNSAGVYQVDGLENLKGPYPLLIQAITYGKRDILSPVTCLGGVKIVYSFGAGFGNVLVRGAILMGPVVGGAATNNIQALIDWFQSNRASASQATVSMSILNQGAIRAYLDTLTIGEPNAEFQIQPFAIGGILVE